MEDRNVKRGDIYHADLDPVFGSEQGGYRPVQPPALPLEALLSLPELLPV